MADGGFCQKTMEEKAGEKDSESITTVVRLNTQELIAYFYVLSVCVEMTVTFVFLGIRKCSKCSW